jgi:hypothetical protein
MAASQYRVSEAMFKVAMHNPKYLSRDGLLSAERRIKQVHLLNRHHAEPHVLAEYKNAISRVQHAIGGRNLLTKHRLPASELQAALATIARYNPGYLK